MRLESITVQGVLAIDQQTTLHLRDLPPGLIALVGRNGHGKTTLLDAGPGIIHRKFPSRLQKELFDYATGRDSFLEAVYAIEGRGEFRLRVNLDGDKRKADAIIEQRLPGTAPALLTDGKLSTYDARIRDLFPSREMLLASAVAAQNKAGSFSHLDKPGRQDLFAQFLGLTRYERIAKLAKDCAVVCDRVRVQLDAERRTLAQAAAPEVLTALNAEDAQASIDGQQALDARTATEREIDRLVQAVSAVQAQATRYASARQTRADLTEQGRALERALAVLAQRHDAAERAAAHEVTRTLDDHQTRLADFDTRLANNNAVLADADAIRAAATMVRLTQTDLDTRTERMVGLDRELTTIRERVSHLSDRLRLAASARTSLTHAREATAAIDQAPFGAKCGEAKCVYLTRALTAQSNLPVLEQSVAAVEQLEASLEETRAVLSSTEDRRRVLAEEATTLRQTIATQEPKAKRLAHIDSAQERITALTEERARLLELHEATVATIQTRLEQTLADLAQDAALKTSEQAQHEATVAAIEQVLAETQDASDDLARLMRDLDAARRQRDALVATVARLDAAAEERQRRRQRHAEAAATLTDISVRLRSVEDEVLEYQRIAKACSRDGVPQLEIDAAGPTVSSICNDLLRELAPQFTVEIVTQVAKADGKGLKDAFELKVYDNRRVSDKARDLEDLSGGEQILVDEALKNAIAIFVNSRNISPLETCWRDETTGPLDGENADLYLKMLRRVHEIGGFFQTLYVTHNKSAAMQADAQVVVESGQVRVLLPPYSEAA
jgi:exonuclease SbcC